MRVLAIVAHPDDETLCCGATLARHAAAGDTVAVATFTDGVSSRCEPGDDGLPAAIARRRIHFALALRALGVPVCGPQENPADTGRTRSAFVTPGGAGYWACGYTDQRLAAVGLLGLAQDAAKLLGRYAPALVYTHWPDDLNEDHRLVAEAVLVATRPGASSVAEVRAGETPSSTEWAFGRPAFRPDTFIDVEATLPAKLAALACYRDERRPYPHPRSAKALLALARVRGAQAGLEAAEAFVTLRRVIAAEGR